jgi:ribosomal protein L19E
MQSILQTQKADSQKSQGRIKMDGAIKGGKYARDKI